MNKPLTTTGAGNASESRLYAAGYNHPTGGIPSKETAPRVHTNAKETVCNDLLPDYLQRYTERLSRIGYSPLKAVKAKCFECSGYSAFEQNKCNNRNCALWVLLDNRKQRRMSAATDVEDNETTEQE